MKIQTFSIVAGSEACNARCPFCISKMTVPNGVELKEPAVNWRNFGKACLLAQRCGVTTAMITGKGEPTLFPSQVHQYLEHMKPFGFPLTEIQSNGIPTALNPDKYRPWVTKWHEAGLTLMAVSIVHWEPEKNREVYVPYMKSYIDLAALIRLLHDHGLSVRLTCTMLKGFVDSPASVEGLIDFAREHKVEQLSVRPVNKPETSRDPETFRWTVDRCLSDAQQGEITAWFGQKGAKLMSLMHGAVVYDVGGQNVCLTNCLTIDPSGDDLRQLIFFPDGHLRYDWQYAGAILL